MEIKSPAFLLSYDHGGYIFWGERFKECLEQAFAWLDKYPAFKIGLDNESFAYDAYAEDAPEIITLITDGLKRYAGRFGIGSCTYGQPLAAYINEESNVRQLVYANRTNIEYFGVTPYVYAVSEHAFHNQIPQLIVGTGFKAAVMRTHFMMYGYNPTYRTAIGKWTGADGTMISTIPTYDGQGASFAETTFDNWVLTRWPDKTSHSLEDFCSQFNDINPLLASRYDDIILRCEELVRHTQDNPLYQWVLLEDLLNLYPQPETVFTPKPGEFKSRMPWGYCGNKIWNDCRKAESYTALAERANAIAVLLGSRDQGEEIEEAWKKLLIAQHHDIQICGLVKEAEQYLTQSVEISKTTLSVSMRALAHMTGGGDGLSVVVFNPLSWDARQPVTCDIELPKNSAYKGFSLVCGDEEVPCEADVYDYDKKGIRRAKIYFTADMPSLAVKRYQIRNAMSDNSDYVYDDGVLRGPLYQIKLNENGILSITDTQTGMVLVKDEQGVLFSGMIDGVPETSRGLWKVFCYHGTSEAVYIGTIGSVSIKFSMRLYSDSPRIDCSVSFQHHGERIGKIYNDTGTTESFYALPSPKDNLNGFIHNDKLCFDLRLPFTGAVTKTHDLPFMVTNTDDDIVQCNYWISIHDNTTGVAFLNRGAMCALYQDGLLKVPLAYAHDYVWGSRMLYGDYLHEFVILPFMGTPVQAGIHREAIAYQYPFIAVFEKDRLTAKRDLPCVVQPIQLKSDPNAVMSALYTDNGKVLLRMYEYNGQPASVYSSLGLCEANLLGEAIGSSIQRHTLLGAYKIQTFSIIPACKPI